MQNKAPNELSQPDREKVTEFLKKHPVGVLASVDENGDPHASTIYFSVDNNLRVTFTTKRDTRKHQNISKHDRVMLAVYESSSQSGAQLSGKAVEVTDAEEAQKIYHGTLNAAQQTGEDNVPPIAKIAAGPYIAYSIEPDNIGMAEYGWGNNFAQALKRAAEPKKEDLEDPA